MKSWAIWAVVSLASAWISEWPIMFWISVWVFGITGILAVLVWLTPPGRAGLAAFEREELAKQRDRLDARLRKLGGPPHVASSDEGRPSSSRSTHRSA